MGRVHPLGVYPSSVIYPTCFFCTSMPFVLFSFYFTIEFILYRSFSFYYSFQLWLFEFNDDIIMSLFLFLILSFYHFVNLNFICNNNSLYIRLSFYFTYGTDEEIRGFEIYLPVISNDMILILLFTPSSNSFLFVEDS